MPARFLTNPGFLSTFYNRHTLLPDRPFCWVLGAGASVQSGIPTGGELVGKWLAEIQVREDTRNLPLAQWATADRLGIDGFEYGRAANFYPYVYRRRYEHYREEGYAFLESAMENREPSYGYSVLARIMADTHHKAAVTTNFDNLIADALAIYTRKLPLVCGHESLTGFIRPNLQRPLVAKVHRDLLLKPKNEPQEIGTLPAEWSDALKVIFASYTPVVIGYDGNDGSLMHFLEALEPIKGGIFWCYRPPKKPDERVQKLVERHNGELVPIHGFDELMLQLGEKLNLGDPRPVLKQTHDRRVAEWQRQFEELSKRLKEPATEPASEEALQPARAAAAAAVERLTKEKDWWAWQLKVNAESDPAKKEAIFREGLEDFPESVGLKGNFALFLHNVREAYDEAERFYRRALELDPHSAIGNGNLALFLHGVRKKYDEAEQLYRRAIELNPNGATNNGGFALFLSNVREKYDEAERLYRHAIELDPQSAVNTGNFASFVQEVRKDYDEAERLYRRALELDPQHANNTGNFAVFLQNVRKDYEGAERLYRRALELSPQSANHTGNFAVFLQNVRKDYEGAERFLRRAVELAPEEAHWQKQLQRFLEKHPPQTPPAAPGVNRGGKRASKA